MSEHEQTMLVLCGLIGSGKSTFAKALQTHVPSFVRCNQDELGRRQDVELLVRVSLMRGDSVCVDRTNVDPNQRRTWVDIARSFPGTKVWALVLDTPYDLCAERIMTRTDHPTITSPTLGLEVLARFAGDFQPPTEEEGFDRIFSLPPHSSPDYSHADIISILDQIRSSPALPGYAVYVGRREHVMGGYSSRGRGQPRGRYAPYPSNEEGRGQRGQASRTRGNSSGRA